MRRLIRLAITIVLIVLCVKCVKNCNSETPIVNKEAVAEHVAEMMPDEIILEKSDDPYDILYGVNQEEGVYRPAEHIFGGLGILVESFNEHFKGE